MPPKPAYRITEGGRRRIGARPFPRPDDNRSEIERYGIRAVTWRAFLHRNHKLLIEAMLANNKDGARMYASVQTLAGQTGMSERTCQRAMHGDPRAKDPDLKAGMITLGLIAETDPARNNGPDDRAGVTYRLVPQALRTADLNRRLRHKWSPVPVTNGRRTGDRRPPNEVGDTNNQDQTPAAGTVQSVEIPALAELLCAASVTPLSLEWGAVLAGLRLKLPAWVMTQGFDRTTADRIERGVLYVIWRRPPGTDGNLLYTFQRTVREELGRVRHGGAGLSVHYDAIG